MEERIKFSGGLDTHKIGLLWKAGREPSHFSGVMGLDARGAQDAAYIRSSTPSHCGR
jgi:hypothetical protein